MVKCWMSALAALFLCLPVAADAQQNPTTATCAKVPGFYGCLPPASVVSRNHTLPVVTPNGTASTATVDQILKQLNSTDVTNALGFTPGTGSGGGGGGAPLTAGAIAGALNYTPVAPTALTPISAAAAAAAAQAAAAQTTASTAQTTATTANTSAAAAQTAATTATTNASAAQSAASSASTTAAVAQTTAQTAETTATAAQAQAAAAQTAAAAASVAAANAVTYSVDAYGGICLTFASGQILPATAACGYVPPSASALMTAGASPPGLVLTVDPAMTTQTAVLASAAAGVSNIQVDNAGDVLALNDPISATQFAHGYGEVALLPSGAGGRPYFHSGTNAVNSGYDGVVIPNALGAPLFAPVGQAFSVYMIVRQNCTGTALELFRAYSATGTHLNVFQASATDGALNFGQNNGAANGTETPSAATACGHWQVIEFSSDGTHFNLYRNGVRTAQTAAAGGAGQVAGFTSAPVSFEFMNACQCDLGGAEILNGGLSIAEDNAETARLGALFGITVSAVTVGNASHIAIVPIDHTQEFLTTPNFPTSDNLPTTSSPVLHAGLTLATGAVSKAHVDFTPSGNITNRAALDAAFYYNPFSGNQNVVTGNPQDGNIGNTFTAFRRYPAGHVYDVHTFGANGLTLGAYCSQNNTAAGCYDGGIYGGMIRAPTNVLPGDIVEWGFRKGNSVRNWSPGWLFGGVQHTPGPGGNPFGNYGQPNAYLQAPACYHEFDEIDGWHEGDVAMGRQLNYGAVAGYEYAANLGGSCFVTAPHEVYDASGGNFTFHPGVGSYPHSEVNSTGALAPWNDGNQHYFAIQMRGDGSHLVDHFYDGKLYATQYYEYADQAFTNPVSGVADHIGMHFRIDNTAIPTFTGDTAGITPQDGVPGSWNVTVSGFDIIHGSISNVAASTVTTDANGTNSQALNGLTNFAVATPLVPGSGVHWANLGGLGLVGSAPYASVPSGFPQTLSTPYTGVAALHPTASQTLEMQATITPNAVDIGAQSTIMGVWGGGGQQAFVLILNANGTLTAATSNGTTIGQGTSSVTAGLSAGVTATVDALINIPTGAVTFYTYPGGVKTQLGSVQAGTAGIVPGAASSSLMVGNRSDFIGQFYGAISSAQLSVGGTVVANPVFGPTTTTDSTGLVWTASPGVVFQ